MAKRHEPAGGSWLLAEELLDHGDPAFVDELRRIAESDRLGNFAAKWYADRRPNSHSMLLEYLNRPLNAYRHSTVFAFRTEMPPARPVDRYVSCYDCVDSAHARWLENWSRVSLRINLQFLEMEWAPKDADRDAAWELYIKPST